MQVNFIVPLWNRGNDLLMLLENSPYELELTSFNVRESVEKKQWDAVFKIRLLSFIQ